VAAAAAADETGGEQDDAAQGECDAQGDQDREMISRQCRTLSRGLAGDSA
jgi:hypothetical protein